MYRFEHNFEVEQMPETNWTVSLSHYATTTFLLELKEYDKVPKRKILIWMKGDCKNSKKFTTGQMTSSFKHRDYLCSSNDIQGP